MSTPYTRRIPATSSPRGRRSRAFVTSGLIAIAVSAIAVPLGLFDWLPFIGARLGGGSPVGLIALLVLMSSLWVIFFVVARLYGSTNELAGVNQARLEVASGQPPRRILGSPLAQTTIGRRIQAIVDQPQAEPEQVTAARSELDHARTDVYYGPARALVWALPALGFLGTAAEMSRAIGGLGNTVGSTTGYADLRTALVSNVIPPLGDAFGVTLFALSASVVCHLLLTWTNSREQRVLLEVEDVMLQVVAAAAAARRPPQAPAPPATLNGELTNLTSELSATRTAMSQSVSQISSMGLGQLAELAPLLRSANQQLSQIVAELQREIVLTRMPHREPLR